MKRCKEPAAPMVLDDSTHSLSSSAESASSSSPSPLHTAISDRTTTKKAAVRTRKPSSQSTAADNNNNTCNICRKAFQYGNDLRKHLRIHSDERPYPCEHCGQRFRQAGCLKNHVASQHGSAHSFQCHYCAKVFPIKERLRLHMRIHSGVKPYACGRCRRSFSRGGQLKQHMITHQDCRSDYLLTAAGGEFVETDDVLPAKRIKTNAGVGELAKSGDRLRCAFCGEKFPRPLLLKKHSKECDKRTETGDGLLQPRDTATFDCDVCESTFAQLSQLRVHKRMHSGERPYKCQVCFHTFAHSSVLKLHIRKHTGEKPFKCPVCTDPTAFSQLPHLKTHMRTIHGMDKTYQCVQCAYFYKTKNELLLHTAACCPPTTTSAVATTPTPPLSRLPGVLATAGEDGQQQQQKQQADKLSHMRLCVAVLLKRISTGDRLKQLGFEKVLIDNVIMTALRKAGRPYEAGGDGMSDLDRFSVNVRYFLEWTIPKTTLERFEHKETNVKELLVKLTQNQ